MERFCSKEPPVLEMVAQIRAIAERAGLEATAARADVLAILTAASSTPTPRELLEADPMIQTLDELLDGVSEDENVEVAIDVWIPARAWKASTPQPSWSSSCSSSSPASARPGPRAPARVHRRIRRAGVPNPRLIAERLDALYQETTPVLQRPRAFVEDHSGLPSRRAGSAVSRVVGE